MDTWLALERTEADERTDRFDSKLDELMDDNAAEIKKI
jgi:hypothetical protein